MAISHSRTRALIGNSNSCTRAVICWIPITIDGSQRRLFQGENMASQFLVGYAMVASHPRRCGTRLGGRPLDQRVSREFVENRRGVKGIKVIEKLNKLLLQGDKNFC